MSGPDEVALAMNAVRVGATRADGAFGEVGVAGTNIAGRGGRTGRTAGAAARSFGVVLGNWTADGAKSLSRSCCLAG
jgi:hypothetical protein